MPQAEHYLALASESRGPKVEMNSDSNDDLAIIQHRVLGTQKHWTFIWLSHEWAAVHLKVKANVPQLWARGCSLPPCCLIPPLLSTLILFALRTKVLTDSTKVLSSPRVAETHARDPVCWETGEGRTQIFML